MQSRQTRLAVGWYVRGCRLLTVKVSYFTVLEDAKIAFNARVAASMSFRLSWMASRTGLLSGNSSVSSKGTTAPDATTADTFSSFPANKIVSMLGMRINPGKKGLPTIRYAAENGSRLYL